MPSNGVIRVSQGLEDSGVFVMDRVRQHDGSLITIATTSGITVSSYDLSDGSETLAPTALTVADVVKDALQTNALDPRWTEDSTGYNFGASVPGTAFPSAGNYQIKFAFTPTSGDVFYVARRHEVAELYGQ